MINIKFTTKEIEYLLQILENINKRNNILDKICFKLISKKVQSSK